MQNRFKILTGLLLYSNIAISQFFEYGQDPGNLKWRKMETEHFRLIYPSDFSSTARDLASTIEKYYQPNSQQLNHYLTDINVIVHNQSVISNAFVALAPRRMEFFTQPDPNYFGQEWLTELCLHEFRHAIQMDKLNKGFTRLLTTFAGEQGLGIVAASIPFWFFEGDAVSAETDLSLTGRGRLPAFEMEIKAHLLNSDRPYSFSKSYLGSYRDFVPDYYRYGYQIVSFARKKYGQGYWSDAIDYVAKHPYTIFPFHFYARNKTGKGMSNLYKETVTYLKDHWNSTLKERHVVEIPNLNARGDDSYVSYYQPKFINDSTIIAYKTGLDFIPRFVKLDMEGREKKIFFPGNLVSSKISVNHSRIIWDELAFDARWENRNYSIIKEHDLESGRTRRITSRSRYTAPEYSGSGDTIAAIEAKPQYKFYLVLLSTRNGQVLQRIPSPDNSWLQDPVWSYDKYSVIVISVDKNGKKILAYDLKLKKWSQVFDAGFFNISELNISGDKLFFNASFDGIDNIYSFNLRDSTLSRYSNSRFGAFTPAVSEDQSGLVYSDYSDTGYNIKLNKIDTATFTSFLIPQKITEQSFASVENSPIRGQDTDNQTEAHSFSEKSYSKLLHLFKVHSWAPFYFDYDNPEIESPLVSPGITVLSQNFLSTAVASLAYEYREGTNYFHSSLSYKGFYPVVELSAVYGGAPFISVRENTELPEMRTNFNYKLSSYIPLKFNTGHFFSGCQPSASITYNSSYFFYSPPDAYKRGIIFFEPAVYAYSFKAASWKDIQPELGITANIKMINAPFEDQLFGSNNLIDLTLYFPGILKHHGLKLKGGWQNQVTDRYLFKNLLRFPRGYDELPALTLRKYSGDYVLPLLYPDINLGPVLYIKRLRADLFIDYMKGFDLIDLSGTQVQQIPSKEFISEGAELYFDYHIFRFLFEFSSGIRFSYLPYEKRSIWQILFTVNLSKFI